MIKEKKKQEEKKTTNEKPVSLGELNFKEALSALLKIRPPKEDKKEQKEKSGN